MYNMRAKWNTLFLVSLPISVSFDVLMIRRNKEMTQDFGLPHVSLSCCCVARRKTRVWIEQFSSRRLFRLEYFWRENSMRSADSRDLSLNRTKYNAINSFKRCSFRFWFCFSLVFHSGDDSLLDFRYSDAFTWRHSIRFNSISIFNSNWPSITLTSTIRPHAASDFWLFELIE